MELNSLILLYSGGLESSVLLSLALRLGYTVHCVIVDYGQVHREEVKVAERNCENLGVSYEIIKVAIPTILSKLTTKDFEVEYNGVSPWYVPSRNLIFVSIAASVAESKCIGRIWYGASYTDRIDRFPDCYQEWIVKANELLKQNGSYQIFLEAPLSGMSKSVIWGLAKHFGIKEGEIFSGYGQG